STCFICLPRKSWSESWSGNEGRLKKDNKQKTKAISKLIHFKIDNNIRTKIKGFEAPFRIVADPELIGIGYDVGFGNDNSAGMGCVELID
ncbi:MAG: hypothetical protein KAI84_02580, partial [Gammaproteobacteria bacterium]|nr:hypothetical protein [Gammaproteobacteria bacterium]